MRKIFLFSFWGIGMQLYGAPSGNPAAPHLLKKGFAVEQNSIGSFRVGFEGDFIFDAQMKQVQEGSGRVDKYTQMTNAGTVTLNWKDRFDVYGVLGSTKVSAEWRFSDMAERVRYVEMKTSHNFLWGIGGRAILLKSRNAYLGLNGRYSQSHNHLTWFTIDGENISVAGSDFRSYQWEVNLGVAYHIAIFTPYIAVNYLSQKTVIDLLPTAIADQGSRTNHFKNRIPVGINLGCSLSSGKYFMLNLEARVINEEAVSVSGDFRF